MRTWIEQPYNTRICGQIAVAVVSNIPLEQAISLVGKKKNSTKTIDLAKALRTLGYQCPAKCKRMPKPSLALGQLRTPGRKSGWHWVVIDGDMIYDGMNGNPDGTVNWKKNWGITSYLPITK